MLCDFSPQKHTRKALEVCVNGIDSVTPLNEISMMIFHQYEQNQRPPLISNNQTQKKPMAYSV